MLFTKKLSPLIIFVLLLLAACTPTTKTAISNKNIFYAGGNNSVKAALLKAGYTLVNDFDKAEVFVLNGEIPGTYAITVKLQNGAGLVLIPGDHTSYYGSDLDVQTLIGQPVAGLMKSDNPVSLEVDEFFGKDDPLISEINWAGAPQIRERAFLSRPGPGEPLVRVDGYAEVILDKITDREFYLSVYLDKDHNLQFQKWKYFDYLIYHLVERAAGAKPLSFLDYEAQSK